MIGTTLTHYRITAKLGEGVARLCRVTASGHARYPGTVVGGTPVLRLGPYQLPPPSTINSPSRVALVKPCGGFGGALGWLWWSLGVALGCLSLGYQVALGWPWGRLGVA